MQSTKDKYNYITHLNEITWWVMLTLTATIAMCGFALLDWLFGW